MLRNPPQYLLYDIHFPLTSFINQQAIGTFYLILYETYMTKAIHQHNLSEPTRTGTRPTKTISTGESWGEKLIKVLAQLLSLPSNRCNSFEEKARELRQWLITDDLVGGDTLVGCNGGYLAIISIVEWSKWSSFDFRPRRRGDFFPSEVICKNKK